MNPTPHLTFQGTCREAMETYARIFGGEIDMIMKASELPGVTVPPEKADWIGHCGLVLGDGMILAADDIFGGTPPMGGCSISINMPTTGEGKAAFDKLAEGGSVRMDYQPTFWSPGFGTLTDRFGIHWMVGSDEGSEA